MPSKKKKTPLQKEYEKEYKLYKKRLESARQAGYVIPESYEYVKKDKPRTADIKRLKSVTRNKIQEDIKKGKVEFVDITTGEVLKGRKGFAQSRLRKPKQEYYIPSPERPTSFDEAVYISTKVKDYFDKYNVPESAKDYMIDNLIRTNLESLRGEKIDFEEFKKIEEKEGWLYKDPNRPLEQEEINYIQSQIDTEFENTFDIEEYGFMPSKTIGNRIEELRGWNPDFNYYDKYYQNEMEAIDKPPWKKFNEYEEYSPDFEERKWSTSNHPETIERHKSEISETPVETIALDNLKARLEGLTISGESYGGRARYYEEIGARNKYRLDNWLNEKIREHGEQKVNNALLRASAEGKAFQIYFLYKEGVMGEYLTDLENFLLPDDDYYDIAESIESGVEFDDEY